MKLSVRESGFREPVADYPLDWSLGRIKELGYDGVELCMVPDRNRPGPRAARRGTWFAEYDTEGRKKIRQRAESLGIEIPTLSSDWAWSYSEFSPEVRQWDRGVEIWGEDVLFARDVGAKVILIHFGVSTGTWEQAKTLLGRAADHAAKHGIVLGYEGSIWFRVGLGGQDTLVRMVDEIGSPGLQIYVHPQRDTAQQVKDIEEVGNRLCALHSSALNPDVDYSEVFAALKKVGYDWYWCFEVGGDVIGESVKPWRELARKSGAA